MNTAMYSAITRPRIEGSTAIWTNALAAVTSVSAVESAHRQDQREREVRRHQPGDHRGRAEGDGGADDEPLARRRPAGGEQRAGERPDGDDRAEDAVLAGALVVDLVAISAVVIWKLSPNVPAENTTPITSRMSGRDRT